VTRFIESGHHGPTFLLLVAKGFVFDRKDIPDQFKQPTSDDCLGKRIAIQVANTFYLRLDPGFCQTLCLANRNVLDTTIAVVNKLTDFVKGP